MSDEWHTSVVVVGGGIGGLTAALALQQRDIPFILIEQAQAIETVGAGIQLSPNAVRVLFELGLEDALAPVVVRPSVLEIRAFDTADLILRTPLGELAEAHFGAPYFHAHRADLVDALVAKVASDRLLFSRRVCRYEQEGAGVRVELDDGSFIRGDALVGADGIHSSVREQMHGSLPARYSGTAWRALVPGERIRRLGVEQVSGVWWGPRRSFVHYYVCGGDQFNWIGIVPKDDTSIESWTQRGEPEQVLEEFAGWHPKVTEIIAATDTPYKWALFDRDPLPYWVEGSVGLLGDSAHSMLPYHAQGAAICIEDAYVLAAALADSPVESALQEYESLRRPRATWVQQFSRAAERHFHLADPSAVAQRDRRLRASQAQFSAAFPPGQETIYGYDALSALNA